MSKSKTKPTGLPIINEFAAAIDIGSRFHVVAVGSDLCDEPVRTFQAFTSDLLRMADWLIEVGIQAVAMESTGVYWVAAYEALESRGIHVILANAREARAVPGRKSDVNDAQWLQRLHACGLLRASFRPEREIAALRTYLRSRERHLDYAASHIQHMQKALTFMNLQLHHVISDITGATGMQIIRSIVAGERNTEVFRYLAANSVQHPGSRVEARCGSGSFLRSQSHAACPRLTFALPAPCRILDSETRRV